MRASREWLDVWRLIERSKTLGPLVNSWIGEAELRRWGTDLVVKGVCYGEFYRAQFCTYDTPQAIYDFPDLQ